MPSGGMEEVWSRGSVNEERQRINSLENAKVVRRGDEISTPQRMWYSV